MSPLSATRKNRLAIGLAALPGLTAGEGMAETTFGGYQPVSPTQPIA
jgi:hypothetical protein